MLPGVTRLRLNGFTGNEDLSKVPEHFPNLREVSILLAPDMYDVPEHVLQLWPVSPLIEKTDAVR